MARTLADQLAERPADPANVARHRERMERDIRRFRLRELRQRAQLTQIELASLLHVSQNRVSMMEHGKLDRVQVDTLRKYVEALGGSLSVVVTLDHEKMPLELLLDGYAESTPADQTANEGTTSLAGAKT